jgi:hypothetical protein
MSDSVNYFCNSCDKHFCISDYSEFEDCKLSKNPMIIKGELRNRIFEYMKNCRWDDLRRIFIYHGLNQTYIEDFVEE